MTDIIEKARSKLKEIIIEELSKLNWPELPINSDPPEGDLSVICFPAAKEMKKAMNSMWRGNSMSATGNVFFKDARSDT